MSRLRSKRFFGSGLISFFLAICFCSCSPSHEHFITSSHQHITYWGRVDQQQDSTILYWSGSSIRIQFKGTNISAIINDENGDNDFNVILDNRAPVLLDLKKGKQFYELANSLDSSLHTLVLFKRTEWDRGTVSFHGFQSDSELKLYPALPKKRKILFYGNSITAGYAVEDTTGTDSPAGTFTNNYNTYARATASRFDAEYRCIVKSGIGITVSWFPLIMPEMYDRLNPSDSSSEWDFKLYQPDIVVVNLLQNDSWLIERPNYPEYKKRFTQKPTIASTCLAYADFISTLRSKYPKSEIICCLGNMDIISRGSPWPAAVNKSITSLNDRHIHTHVFNNYSGLAHPNVAEQMEMSESLTAFIKKNGFWD